MSLQINDNTAPNKAHAAPAHEAKPLDALGGSFTFSGTSPHRQPYGLWRNAARRSSRLRSSERS